MPHRQTHATCNMQPRQHSGVQHCTQMYMQRCICAWIGPEVGPINSYMQDVDACTLSQPSRGIFILLLNSAQSNVE